MPNSTSPIRFGAAAVTVLSLLLAVPACSSGDSEQAATGSAAPSTAGLPRAVQGDLQEVLVTSLADLGFPGVQAGVWSPNGQWTGVAGSAGLKGDRPPARDDHTRIGSITKTFTVTALLQLAQEGDLSLDDPIEDYVPGLPNGKTATLRDLAQMTSGIPSYTEDSAFTDVYFADTQKVFTPQELVDVVKGQTPMFPPGTQMYYSNTNTVALGMAIEKVTGKAIGDVFAEQISQPLGLSQTSWPGTSSDLPQPHLSGITEQGEPEGEVKDATGWNPSWAFTAGEMVSTLDDLHTWGVALGTGEGILDAKTQKMRLDSLDQNSTIPPNKPERVYGIGFGRENGWIGHTGELPGYNTSVQYNPQTRTTVVVMVNSDIAVDGKNPAPSIAREIQTVLAASDGP